MKKCRNRLQVVERTRDRRLRRLCILADRSGLTMLETVVALAILTVGIAGVLHAFSASMAANRESEAYSTASILANRVASALDRQTTLEAGRLSGDFDDAEKYHWEAYVEPEDGSGLMRATITVSWEVGRSTKDFEMVICLRAPSAASSEGSS